MRAWFFGIRRFRLPVGLRIIKTAVAVTLSLLIVEQYGASAAKMLFAVMGAISAMEPNFKGSLRSCAAQISSVIVGVLLSVVMRMLEVPGTVASGVGIMIIMTMYQLLHWRRSPVLPCLVLVTICTDPTLMAVPYGLARIWDTTIGLAVGMLINTLVFPYDNSKKIRQVMESLDKDLIAFLEDMFDGDEHLPETEEMSRKIDSLEIQLALFADQRLFRRRRQKVLLNRLQDCEETAHMLLVEVATLRNLESGRLNQGNRRKLRALGARISEDEGENRFSVEDIVVNYHVAKALELREQLKEELSRSKWK